MIDTSGYKPFKLFLKIDEIVRKYPAYTHDDVFFLEYDFAMALLMLDKVDRDYQFDYETISKQLRTKK